MEQKSIYSTCTQRARKLAHLFILIPFLLTNFSCKAPKNIKVRNNRLHYPLGALVSSLDPALSYDSVSIKIVGQIYEPLYQYHYLKRPYEIIPLGASEMPKITENGTRYEIKIKPGMKYHSHPLLKDSGRSVKAQDYLNQIKRVAFIPNRSPGVWAFEGIVEGFDEFRKNVGDDRELLIKNSISGVQAPDDETLIIKLTRPNPQFLYILTMSFVVPIPEEILHEDNNPLNLTEVGTGPYRIQKFVKGQRILLKKFADYREDFYPTEGDTLAVKRGLMVDSGKRIPFIEEIDFQIIKEGSTRWLNFLDQKIDILPSIPKDNFSQALNPMGELSPELVQKGIDAKTDPSLTFWWLAFNMKDKDVGGKENIKLRKAMAMSIDVDKMISLFTNNIAQKANSLIPPGVMGHNLKRNFPYEYNPEKAKEIIKSLGKEGLSIRLDMRGNSSVSRQMGEFLQNEFKEVGIHADLQLNTFPRFLQKTQNGSLQVWLGGWALDYPDAENVLMLLTSKNHPPGPNYTLFTNKEFDEMYNRLRVLPDTLEKYELIKKMENIFFQEFPWALFYYSRSYGLHYKHLKNFRYSDVISNDLKYLRISQKNSP